MLKKKIRCQSYISKSQRKYHIQFLEGSISVLVKTVCVHTFFSEKSWRSR